ncbi:hypothetical protein HN011_008719 [Eciton burchellii]|nr:hypothetical protein HN011_008719 [Eciton burchellii]
MLQSDRAQSPVVDPPGLQTTATRVSTKGAPAPVYAHECLTRCDRVHWRNLRWRSRRIAFARPKYEPEGIESNLIRREEIFADETSPEASIENEPIVCNNSGVDATRSSARIVLIFTLNDGEKCFPGEILHAYLNHYASRTADAQTEDRRSSSL